MWLLRSTRAWLRRDLEVLKPVFERMRVEGADFLQKNAALAEEVRRIFTVLDEIEKELTKAGKSIEQAKTATVNYHTGLSGLCDSACAGKKRQVRKRSIPRDGAQEVNGARSLVGAA